MENENIALEDVNVGQDEFDSTLESINKKNEELRKMELIKKEIKELKKLLIKVENKKAKIKKLSEQANIGL